MPKEYLEELQKLQDRVPVFSTKEALALVEAELGVPFADVFVLEDPNPVAAASIGQVYKARLVANGGIWRPLPCFDIYMMRQSQMLSHFSQISSL